MVSLGDGELVAFQSSQVGRETKKLLYANGKVCAVEKASTLLRLGLQFFQMAIPTGSANHDTPAECQYRANIFYSGFGSGEVDHNVHTRQGGRGNRGGVLVFSDVECPHARSEERRVGKEWRSR